MMIRHSPLGSGHPYADDTDQRSPVLPVAGESLRIGAKASANVDAVSLSVTLTRASGARESVEFAC
jgi:hypothetical protein